jgi:hypothetical protein
VRVSGSSPLTDNLLEVQTRQLEHGGIVDLFERRFSADGVKHHKPSQIRQSSRVESCDAMLIVKWGNIRFGLQADIPRCGNDVRFAPESRHVRCS